MLQWRPNLWKGRYRKAGELLDLALVQAGEIEHEEERIRSLIDVGNSLLRPGETTVRSKLSTSHAVMRGARQCSPGKFPRLNICRIHACGQRRACGQDA